MFFEKSWEIIFKILLTKNNRVSIIVQVANSGVWLSLVERLVRDQEAGGSNPLTPTIEKAVEFYRQPFVMPATM